MNVSEPSRIARRPLPLLVRTSAAFVRARTAVLFALLLSAPTLQATGPITWTGGGGDDKKITTPANWGMSELDLSLLASLQIQFGSSAWQTIELHSHLLPS
ncbi:MAG TPA: hypothetical protein VEA63_17175, partial [Opitutus sp.]|nr:hypothetical protein [Opitutus sp.]